MAKGQVRKTYGYACGRPMSYACGVSAASPEGGTVNAVAVSSAKPFGYAYGLRHGYRRTAHLSAERPVRDTVNASRLGRETVRSSARLTRAAERSRRSPPAALDSPSFAPQFLPEGNRSAERSRTFGEAQSSREALLHSAGSSSELLAV